MDNQLENLILEEICSVAFKGDVETLRTLLKNSINLNQYGRNWTPLHSAIENQNAECVKLLISNGADVEYCGEDYMGTPLEHAIDISIQSNNNTGGKAGEENIEIIMILLKVGADPATGLKIANLYKSKKILFVLNQFIS